jgi:hypothetical protein
MFHHFAMENHHFPPVIGWFFSGSTGEVVVICDDRAAGCRALLEDASICLELDKFVHNQRL